MKFPVLIHAVKPAPHNGMPQAASARDTFWDFASLMPETTHMPMWVMSDRGIPRSLRMMQGFGVHTFRLVNAAGATHFVKFHWKPKLGTHALVWDQAVKIAGADSDFHRRDLWDAIEAGEYPEWELGLQIFTEAQAEGFSFDVLDATKLIPEDEIPINAALAPVHNNQRDGLHRQAIPRGRVAYEPNSLGGGCPFQVGAAGFVSFPQPLAGDKLRGKPEKFADHYTQATLFYESQTEVEKAHIVGGFRFELSKLTVPAIRESMLSSLANVSADMAAKIAVGLGIAVPEAMLIDALVLPDGSDGVAQLAGHGQTLEFVTNQYRHGKTILALGAAQALLDRAGITASLSSGQPDPGILLAGVDALDASVAAFIAATGKHRHPARETDPPPI